MNYLFIYLKITDQIIINHDKRQDPMRHSPQFLCLKSSTPTVNGPKNTILNILGLLGVPILQNMYTLAQWERVWERHWYMGTYVGTWMETCLGTWERE